MITLSALAFQREGYAADLVCQGNKPRGVGATLLS